MRFASRFLTTTLFASSFLSFGCSNPEGACVPEGAEITPQLSPPYKDENCDGIDGDRSIAIFVDQNTGDDNNDGTLEKPMRTIIQSLTKAQTLGKASLYISEGTYQEDVKLVNGISLYGEYSAQNQWKRDPSYLVKIQNLTPVGHPSIGLQGTDIITPTIVSGITIEAVDHTNPGESTYGIHCVHCSGLQLIRTKVLAGKGAAGVPGGMGNFDFTPTPSGMSGSATTCGDGSGMLGGSTGLVIGLQAGGAGGKGGASNGMGSDHGTMGDSGGGGANGGAGGNGVTDGSMSGAGNIGTKGADSILT